MPELVEAPLSAWESFYVIVGSSGGALIGLQFVVMALIADMQPNTPADAVNAFGTPTVVHFTGALIVSAVMSAPWQSLASVSVVLGALGAGGLAYGALIVRRARRQTAYEPVWEDWLWFMILPAVAYTAIAAAAITLRAAPRGGEFVVAAAALALLLIGIHNAWDSVMHIVVTMRGGRAEPDEGVG